MDDETFIVLICDAYRELRNLHPETPIDYKIGVYGTGTLQITLKVKPEVDKKK